MTFRLKRKRKIEVPLHYNSRPVKMKVKLRRLQLEKRLRNLKKNLIRFHLLKINSNKFLIKFQLLMSVNLRIWYRLIPKILPILVINNQIIQQLWRRKIKKTKINMCTVMMSIASILRLYCKRCSVVNS